MAHGDFPGGPEFKNPPDSAGNIGRPLAQEDSPGSGVTVHAPQLLSLLVLAHALQQEKLPLREG